MLLCCSDCTWGERRHGDKDIDRGRVDIDEGMLLADPRSHLALAVLLSELRVTIAIAIAIVGSCSATAVVFLLHLEGGRHGDKDVDRGCVPVVDVDNGLLRSETKKQTRVRL